MLDKFHIAERLGAVCRKFRGTNDKFHMSSDVWIEVRDKSGNLKSSSFQHNLRTNAGADFWDAQLFKVATAAATAEAGAGRQHLTAAPRRRRYPPIPCSTQRRRYAIREIPRRWRAARSRSLAYRPCRNRSPDRSP